MLTLTLRSFRLGLIAATMALVTNVAGAQVGHTPSGSPFRDLVHSASLTLMASDFAGNGGKLGMGPHHGRAYALRFDLRISNPLQVAFTVGGASLERKIVIDDDSLKVFGPVDQKVTMAELAFQFNLTGRKTWHRLAPYVGMGLGVAIAGKEPAADTSGYKFGTHVFLAPSAGLRIFITDRLHLRGEVHQTFWRIKYPSTFLLDPTSQPGTPIGSNAAIKDGRLEEWTGGRQLTVGLGYAFTF